MASKKPKTKAKAPTANLGTADSQIPVALSQSPQVTTGAKLLPRYTSTGGAQAPAPVRTPTASPTASPVTSPVPATTALPSDPLAALTPDQMQGDAQANALQTIQGLYAPIKEQQALGQSAHNQRSKDISSWAGWQQGQLNDAFGATREAINQIMAQQAGTDTQSQAALAAALRAANGGTENAASLIGGGAKAPGSNEQAALASADQSNKMAEQSVNQTGASNIANMGQLSSLGSVGLSENQNKEQQRWNAENQGYQAQLGDVSKQLPALVQTSLKDQRDYEIAKGQLGETKANNAFQQYIAERQQNTADKNETFQEWLSRNQLAETTRSNKAGEANTATANTNTANQIQQQGQIDWFNAHTNRTSAEGQLAQIRKDAATAKTKAEADKATARGTALVNAYQWLSGWLAPVKGQASSTHSNYPYGPPVTDDPTTAANETQVEYKKTYADALAQLQNMLPKSDALRVLSNSQYSDWRNKANADMKLLKRRGIANRKYPNVTQTPPAPKKK